MRRLLRPSEVDFGYHWRPFGDESPGHMRYRISWNEQTGELYAMGGRGGHHRQTVAYLSARENVDKLMEGWEIYGNPIYHDLMALHARAAEQHVSLKS